MELAVEDREAPFGLKWGMSSNDVITTGVTLSAAPEGNDGIEFIAMDLNKTLSDIDIVVLGFGFDDRLWRVTALGRAHFCDPHGFSVRQRYEELATILNSKYGKGKSVHDLYWKDSSDFMLNIYTSRGCWFTRFDARNMFVHLSIAANDSESGYWTIIAVNKELEIAWKKYKLACEYEVL
jgi:hypothetical protein